MSLLLKKEVFFVKFPIIFPLVYLTVLYSLPSFETHLIFLTILILAETHFGATWPFFLNKVNFPYIKQKKIERADGDERVKKKKDKKQKKS